MAWSQQKKTEPAKVVVWGIGEDYNNVYNSIELQILKNNIENSNTIIQKKLYKIPK